MTSSSPRPIVVLGAGVIGLTTAVRLLESPLNTHSVHIIADHLPADALDPRYASTIAGAHHLSFADDGDERQRRWDRRTFQVMYAEWLARGETTGLMALTQTELWVGSTSHLKIYEEHPDFALLDPSTAPCPADHMIKFTSLTITPSLYLASLLRRLSALGAVIHRAHLPSLAALLQPEFTTLLSLPAYTPPAAVVNCTGLGALTLGGVRDGNVYPTRGQVVRVHAPWVRAGTTRQEGALDGAEGGKRTYVIPRCTGDVVLGGTREEGDWEGRPRLETKRDILQRVLEIAPEVAPPHAREVARIAGVGVSVESLEGLVVADVVGFRPSRVGGTRLEKEEVRIGGEGVVVVHNYGHGGAGWQSSWGSAEDAVALVLEKGKARL